MSNDRFTIPELVLPIASKMLVTHYPRTLKKKNKQMCSYKLKQPNKQGCSCELKRIYIYICGVHLGLFPQTSLGGLCLLSSSSLSLPILLRLLPRGNLGLYLFYCGCILNSLGIYAQVCMMCLHVHSLGTCARVLFVLTHEGVLGE